MISPKFLLDLVMRLHYLLEDLDKWLFFHWESELRAKMRKDGTEAAQKDVR